MSQKIKLLLGGAALFCTLWISYFSYTEIHTSATSKDENIYTLTEPEKTVHEVDLTSKGFVPKTLVIRQGEKVIFKNSSDEPFWPASDSHPTHTIYPEFDAKNPVVPPENYEFVFDKSGSWRYHDHLAHTYTGVINVVETGKESIAVANYSNADCTVLSDTDRALCWDERIREVARTQGVDAAFDFFIALYKQEDGVEKSCHEWIHALGEAAYDVYKQGGDVHLRPETSWCSYGYFHGFINAMIWETGSIEKVIEFCNAAVENSGSELPFIKSNCFHGTGHAGIDLLFNKAEYWGDFKKTANAGFAECDRLFGKDELINECYGGVIHGLRFSMRNNEHGMNFDIAVGQKDPYYYCRDLDHTYQLACFTDFASMFWDIFNGDIKEAVNYIINERISDPLITRRSLLKASAAWVEHDLSTNNHKDNVEACRSVPEDMFSDCFRGIGVGFIQHGEPDNMHEKAFAFCRSDYLTDPERELCFTMMPQMLADSYSPQQFTAACHTLAPSEKYGLCSIALP